MTVLELIDRAEKYVRDHRLTDDEIGKLFSLDWLWGTHGCEDAGRKLDEEMAGILTARNTGGKA